MASVSPPPCNWVTTESGELQNLSVRVYSTEDGSYDILCDNGSHGISFEKCATKQFCVVRSVLPTQSNARILNSVNIGDVLVSVNGKIVLKDELSDVVELLDSLQLGTRPIRLKFLNPAKQGIAAYAEMLDLGSKVETDIYGFTRTVAYINAERDFMYTYNRMLAVRDMEWVEYLKSIGVILFTCLKVF